MAGKVVVIEDPEIVSRKTQREEIDMAADLGLRPNGGDGDEPLTTTGIHRATFLTDGAEMTAELWLRENDELHRVVIPWIPTIDLPAIRRFLDRLRIPTETIDNS